MGTAKYILGAIVFASVMIALYQLLKVFVISKVKNQKLLKYVTLAVAIIMFIINIFVSDKFKAGSIAYYASMTLFIISIFTVFDVWMGKYKKAGRNNSTYDSSIKPKPKAKPNRVKNRHKK